MAEDTEEFPNAKCIISIKYKTSMLYGKKMMVLPIDVFKILEIYITVLRPQIIDNKNLGLYRNLIICCLRFSNYIYFELISHLFPFRL